MLELIAILIVVLALSAVVVPLFVALREMGRSLSEVDELPDDYLGEESEEVANG